MAVVGHFAKNYTVDAVKIVHCEDLYCTIIDCGHWFVYVKNKRTLCT